VSVESDILFSVTSSGTSVIHHEMVDLLSSLFSFAGSGLQIIMKVKALFTGQFRVEQLVVKQLEIKYLLSK